MLSVSPNYEVKPLTLLDAVVATGSAAAALPPGRKSFHIVMASGTATLKIEGSNDGTNWVTLHTETTSSSAANKLIECDDIFAKHRANVSAWTSGAVTVTAASPVAK